MAETQDGLRKVRCEIWRKIRRYKSELLDAKQEVKDAKDRLDGAYSEMDELMKEEFEPVVNLFNQSSAPPAAYPRTAIEKLMDELFGPPINPATGEVVAEPAAPATPPAAQAEDTSWRTVLLSTLGLPPTLTAKLADAKLLTIGDVADFTSNPHNKLTDVKGVGDAKAELICQAIDSFWAKRKNMMTPGGTPAWHKRAITCLKLDELIQSTLCRAGLLSLGAIVGYVKEQELVTCGLSLAQSEEVRKAFMAFLGALPVEELNQVEPQAPLDPPPSSELPSDAGDPPTTDDTGETGEDPEDEEDETDA